MVAVASVKRIVVVGVASVAVVIVTVILLVVMVAAVSVDSTIATTITTITTTIVEPLKKGTLLIGGGLGTLVELSSRIGTLAGRQNLTGLSVSGTLRDTVVVVVGSVVVSVVIVSVGTRVVRIRMRCCIDVNDDGCTFTRKKRMGRCFCGFH